METAGRRRALVLVDAEHHPDAVRDALDELAADGDEPALVVYLGGSEKVDEPGTPPEIGWPAVWPRDPTRELPSLIDEIRPDVVIDRSADPVVDDRRRNRLASAALAAGTTFEAPGLTHTPPPRPQLTEHPSVAVIATGKRTGKTAVSGALARYADRGGRRPVVVAMGRGGPPDPVVIPAGQELALDRLLAVAAEGGHAASDFYEDAVMTGVATIGCRRVGEGPSGEVGTSNVAAGLAAVADLDVDLVVLEGSGAAIPPCHADATALIVPATADPHALHAMLPLRFLLADLIVITLADPRLLPEGQLSSVMEAVDEVTRHLPGRASDRCPGLGIVTTRFKPTPLRDVSGRRALVATTAPESVGPALRADLEEAGIEVVGLSHALADRPRLRRELADAPEHEVLLTELKAAAIDVAARAAGERGAEVVFYDNRPVVSGAGAGLEGVAGHDELGSAFAALVDAADAAKAVKAPDPVDHYR